jgi:hypothetical protein
MGTPISVEVRDGWVGLNLSVFATEARVVSLARPTKAMSDSLKQARPSLSHLTQALFFTNTNNTFPHTRYTPKAHSAHARRVQQPA